MRPVHVRQTYRDPQGRQHTGRGLGPFDEADRVLEVRLEVTPLRGGDALEPEQIEVGDIRVSGIAVADGEGRARHMCGDTERAAGTADEGRLAAPELSGDGDDVARHELAREPYSDRLGLRRRGGA